MMDKARLRKHMRSLRREAFARNPDASEQLADRFPMKLLERFGPEVGSYWAAGAEIDPRALEQKLATQGARLSLPHIGPDNSLSFHRFLSVQELEVGPRRDIRQPPAEAEIVEPTLVLVPLLAFDRSGNRLGQGQGFFDRYLAARRARAKNAEGPRVFAVGLAFASQGVDALPTEPHDEPLDWIATEQAQIAAFMLRASTR